MSKYEIALDEKKFSTLKVFSVNEKMYEHQKHILKVIFMSSEINNLLLNKKGLKVFICVVLV